MNGAWAILGIARDADRDTIRKAYARKLKVTNPEDDPEGFKRLRAAYEQAIEALRWAHYEIDEEEGEDDTVEAAHDGGAGDDARWSEPPDDDAATRAPDLTVEEQQHAADLAAFHDIAGVLAATLEAPERDDGAVQRHFAAFRQAPALTEIAVRASAEAWLADLLARTVPQSDAILREAAELFGWNDSRRRTWSVMRVMARLDEWALIAALDRADHRLHRGWLALRRTPKSALAFRLAAFTPGVAGQVRSLLERIDGDAPGVAYSLDPIAVTRWREWLSTPRITPGKLIATPIALATLWLLARLVAPGLWRTLVLGLGAGIAVALPWLLLVGERRQQGLAARPPWLQRGWLVAYVLTASVALLTPPGTIAALVVTVLAAITGLWIGLQRGIDEPLTIGRSGIVWLALAYIVGVVGIGFMRIDASSALILGVVLPLYPLMRIIAWRRLTFWVALWRPMWRDVGLSALVLAAIVLTVAGGAVRTRFGIGMMGEGFVSCLVGGVLILPPTALLGAFGSFWGKLVHFIVVRALTVALIATLSAGLLHEGDDADVADAGLSPAAVIERRADRLLDDIKRREPGFAQIAIGNPELYAAFRATAQRNVRELRSERLVQDINALIAERYEALLPGASNAQLAEELRVRLAERQALLASDAAACADPKRPAPTPALAARRKALVFDVLANPPATAPTEGRALTNREIVEEAMRKQGLSAANLKGLFADDAGPAQQCRAAIIYLDALAAHSDADIATTVRAERKRIRKRPAVSGRDNGQ